MATLSVRSINIRDIPNLHDLYRVHVAVGLSCASDQELSSGILGSLPFARRFRRVFVATLDDRLAALVELEPSRREYRWLVTRLAVNAGLASEESWVELWSELLVHAVRAAGAAGAKRLHAAPAVNGPAFEALRHAGFSVYAHQTTLLAQGLHFGNHEEIPVREQEPSDAWSIHQLYHLATPHPVQYAEALTSDHWDVRRDAGSLVRGFLAEDDHQVVAYCRVRSRRRIHVLDLLALPRSSMLVGALVPLALARIGAGPKDSVWVSVPDYQMELLAPLEAQGLDPVDRQARMVRYTAVPVRPRVSTRLQLVPEVGERLAPRMPSLSSSR
ncbi:MAG TPA: hypothetical protein VFN57_05620 [Thermomicrobiaceae bacterium]|nr:hypothetical protein [Thermomicrobiaceae bacterium]